MRLVVKRRPKAIQPTKSKLHTKHINRPIKSEVPALPDYLDNAGNVSVAVDNLSVRFGDLALLPKTINVFRELYQDELFEIKLRMEQRTLRKQAEEEQKQSGDKGTVGMDGTRSQTRKRKATGDTDT
uniref:Uncharacterized protein n=1 Tax=Parascaris univalens TaxID=6257 RepID=A0A915CJZ4_PARUN